MTSPSTTGIELKTRRPIVGEIVELISSMRFAIALLAMIAIAAIIGTVMKQGEASTNYINQFGPFWYEIFRKIGLYTVYSTWWFLLLMAALVTSTTLCIVRNAPKMLKDMRSWRENVREQSLLNFHHKMQWQAPLSRAALAQQSAARLQDAGYQVKLVEKENGTLVAAKQGAANKFGYIFAHASIVIICIGGLLDSDMPIRLQEWFFGKTPFSGSGLISQVPAQHRLGVGNPTFRGNTMIPGRAEQQHRHPGAAGRCPDPGTAVHHQPEKIHHRFLQHRHAQAVCQRRPRCATTRPAKRSRAPSKSTTR